MRAYKILLRSYKSVFSLQVFLTDGLVELALNRTGNDTGKDYKYYTYLVPKGD